MVDIWKALGTLKNLKMDLIFGINIIFTSSLQKIIVSKNDSIGKYWNIYCVD